LATIAKQPPFGHSPRLPRTGLFLFSAPMAIVGIDLGTTHSLVAVFENGLPALLPNAHGELLTPSVVGVLDDGRIVVGAPARELRLTKPMRVAATFKRLMGTDKKTRLGDHEFTPEELSALVLKSLKADAEKALGKTVTEAVITVPAYFNENQRKATRVAGELAGFKVRRIVNEPTAAALAYGFHDRAADSKSFLVFDLGGGTFDVTVMELFEGALQILTTAGESFLGGEDFTEALATDAAKQVGADFAAMESADPVRRSRLIHAAEKAKRELSEKESVVLRVPGRHGELTGATELAYTREQFLTVSAPLLRRLLSPVGRVLRDAELRPQDVSEIVLVGGATRSPVVSEWVAREFGRAPLCRFNPDHVVALGAAVQAALIGDDEAVADMVMTDVCPFTLGIEIMRTLGNRKESGHFMPIIHRNTTIPVSREEAVFTVDPWQREILVKVFQGDGRRVETNVFLGELAVKDLPGSAEPVQVLIRFSYDISGLLEVEAAVPSTGKRHSAVITKHTGGLTEADIRASLDRLGAVKFFPRDDVENRRLTLFAERVIPELPLVLRDELVAAIDAYESSMNGGEREFFKSTRDALTQLLTRIGHPYASGEKDTTHG
jgi:molecular chaperone HscC